MKQLVGVLHNIRSLYNVGSIFRTSDALGVAKLYLCGITGTPEHPRLAKTALAALTAVPWVQRQSALRTVTYLKRQGYTVVALEITPESQPLRPIAAEKIALVVGHEREGVEQRLIDQADYVMHIPMCGVGRSMNVAVAYGIAVQTLFLPAEQPG